MSIPRTVWIKGENGVAYPSTLNEDSDLVLRIPCPACGAGIGVRCQNGGEHSARIWSSRSMSCVAEK